MINLIFDVDDTIYNQLEPFENAVKKIFYNYGDLNPLEIFKSHLKYSDELLRLTENGTLSLEDMRICRITKALSDFGKSITVKEAKDFQKEYEANQEKIIISNGIREVLDFGKENNLKMGIITNGPTRHQSNKINNLGLNRWIDNKDIFISQSVGIAKPEMELFKLVEDRMELNLDNTYYIGDSINNDIVGAKSAGWKMIWISRRGASIPANLGFYPDYIVNDDSELIDLIKDIYKGNTVSKVLD